MRAAAIVLALSACLAGCKSSGLPSGFGVNLTISELQLATSDQQRIASVHLSVTGDETYDRDLELSRFSSGQARMHYVPSVQSGTLLFTVTAADSSGGTVAVGASGNVMLVAGKAVPASVILAAAGGSADMSVPDLAGLCQSDALLPQKTACQADCQCQTGHCVDGLCCDSACAGACMACNVAGMEGSCSSVPAGAAPASGHAACGPDVAKCQRDGFCDGKGACRLTPSGTMCKASQCVSNLFTAASLCDGMGNCATPSAIACDPYVCKDASICWPSCQDGTQCSSGNSCTNMSCGLKPAGALCTDKSECGSGNCLDGFCCMSATCPSCRNCSSTGMCDTVVASKDDTTAGICSVTSTCDSGGTCKNVLGQSCTNVSGVECLSGNCVDGFCCGAASCAACRNCDASGACNAVVVSANDTTATLCSGSDTCSAAGACKLVNGQACGTDGTLCASGNCVNSVCCDKTAAMCSGCQRCDNAGNVGVCSNVPNGTDPNNSCPTSTADNAPGGYTCKNGACVTQCTCATSSSGQYACDNQPQDLANGTADCKKCYYCSGAVGSAQCLHKVKMGISCGLNIQCGITSSCFEGSCQATCTP